MASPTREIADPRERSGRPPRRAGWLILALAAALPGPGWCGGPPAAPAVAPAAAAASAVPAAPAALAVPAAPVPSAIPDIGRFFGTWLWLRTEGLAAESNPETKGAHRRLVLKPDLTYEFHQRRATRDTVLCRGRYMLSEQTGPEGGETDFIAFDGWHESYEKQMAADFDAPDTLHLIGYPCENCPDHTFVRGHAAIFQGEVVRGRTFRSGLFDGLRFELVPTALGWEIAVRDTARPDENLARLTPPLRTVPNPRLIEGGRFRTAANTGLHDGDVNAPEDERVFIFSREVGRSIQGPGAGGAPTEEETARVAEEGRGALTIEEMKLREPRVAGKAGIEWMRFTVAIEAVTPTAR